jgi:ribulose-phosphate 3-epimerase
MRSPARIAPSILAADFAHLAADVARVAGQVDMLHVDVMDGHFVPNISFGPPVIRSLSAVTDLHLDCHLMITDPVRYLEALRDAGADGVTAHIEAIPDPGPFFDEASALGLEAGLVLNPDTPVEAVEPYLDRCALVLVMSVHPGFGGQTFITDVLPKIERLRESVDSSGLATDIQVDGGIDATSVGPVHRAGADIVVAGTSVFRADDPAAAVADLYARMTDNGAA